MALVVVILDGVVMVKKMGKGKKKIAKVMREFKHGDLKSGKKGPGKGPVVKKHKQAIAIALSEARKEGSKIPKKGSKK